MVWQTLAATAVSEAAGGAGSGGPAAAADNLSFNDRSVINIQRDQNVGEILRLFMGPETNGGFGAPPGSRYIPTSTGNEADALRASEFAADGSNFPWLLLAGGLAALTTLVLVFK